MRVRTKRLLFCAWLTAVPISGEAAEAEKTERSTDASGDSKDRFPVPETTVVGGTPGYEPPAAASVTRDSTPLRDIPQSIQVVPEPVLRDRQVVRLAEVADNVSGVLPAGGYGGLSSNDYYVRGFPTVGTLRNGLFDFTFLTPRDVANVERVEFLKGPASILYGVTQPGGIANTVTKRPLDGNFAEFSMSTGSDDFYRPTLDANGSPSAGLPVRFRLNSAYENAGSFRDFTGNESVFVAPTVLWKIGEKTNLLFELEYQDYDYTFDRTFLPEPEFLELPVERFLGEKLGDSNSQSFVVRYDFTHTFNEIWSVRQAFAAQLSSGDFISASPTELLEDGRTLERSLRSSQEDTDDFGLQNQLQAQFAGLGVSHHAIAGVDLSRSTFSYDFFSGTIDPIDIFAPVYGAVPGALEPNFAEKYYSDAIGVFAQDLVSLRDNLKILGGLRQDWVKSEYKDQTTGEVYNENTEGELSPRAGLVWQPFVPTSLYFSWVRSFNPQIFSRSASGDPFDPENGELFEVGVKQEAFDAKVWTTLALYQITKSNVLVPDPNDPDFSIATGEQRSRGVEFDIAGEPLPGWAVIANYAYNDAEVTEDAEIPVGDQLVNAAHHIGRLWTTLRLRSGVLEALGVGGGVAYVGERAATLPNTLEIPSYVRGDLALFYGIGGWEAQLNVKNVSSEVYYESQGFFVVPQAPRTFLGRVAYRF